VHLRWGGRSPKIDGVDHRLDAPAQHGIGNLRSGLGLSREGPEEMSNPVEVILPSELQSDAATAGTVTQEITQTDALDDMEFLDDIDFTLEDVESKIAPLALAHR
jgi:hypothetical protein